MIAHPAIAALREDDRPQRRAQDAVEAADTVWRTGPGIAPILDALGAYADGSALADLPDLAALFEADAPEARRFVDSFVATHVAALSHHPLGHVAARHFSDDAYATLVIERRGPAVLSLVAIDPHGFARRPVAASVDFVACETHEHVLSGEARAERLIAANGPLERRAIALRAGRVIARDGRREGLRLLSVSRGLVLLRLQRRAARPGPTREVRIEDGALLHQSAGSPRDSRLELIMALTRAMDRVDAVPHLGAIALGPESEALRWQALRESLALDSGAGFATLSRIARDSGDPLAAPAGALRAQLLEQWPQLAGAEPCPA